MIDFNKMFESYKKSAEDKIKDAINETKEELGDLTTDRTCMIYSSYLYNNLKKKMLSASIMDTKEDFNMDYRHRFVTVKDKDGTYLIDLTFSQFGDDPILIDLVKNGYDIMTKEKWEIYFDKLLLSTKGNTYGGSNGKINI